MSALIPFPPVVTWSPERVSALRRHYAVGLTAAESALLLGGVSKCAVIAKRNRLGLVGLAAKASPPPSDNRPSVRVQPIRFRPEPVFACEPLPPMDAPPPPGAQPKALADHRPGECLWPLVPAVTPADWRSPFCCAPAAPGRSYCPAHVARALR